MTNYIGTVPATAFETAVKDRFTGLTTNYVDLTYSISNLAEIIIGKQRHGPTGNVKVEFEAMYTKFKDLENK